MLSLLYSLNKKAAASYVVAAVSFMKIENSQLSKSNLLVWLYVTDALFGYCLMRWQFTSSDDCVYLGQIYFNKVLLGQYNSTLGKFIGYTKKTKEIADGLNKNPAYLEQEKQNLERCKTYISMASDNLLKPGDVFGNRS